MKKLRRNQALLGRIKQHSLAGVILLEGLISHSRAGSVALIDRCQSSGVPLAKAHTGGIGQLLEALKHLEAGYESAV